MATKSKATKAPSKGKAQTTDAGTMDMAADTAFQELKGLEAAGVKLVATWWQSHYLGAGHKRLGKALLRAGGYRK